MQLIKNMQIGSIMTKGIAIISVGFFLQSLLLLAYLIRNGSERVVTSAREHLYDLKSLQDYSCYGMLKKILKPTLYLSFIY